MEQPLFATKGNRYALFCSIASVGCLVDLLTKRWVFDLLGLPGGKTNWLWEGVIGFQTSLNRGALFGMAQGAVPILAGLSIAAFLAVVYWVFWGGAVREIMLTIALGCIAAGILGNLYDRLGLPGLTYQGDAIYAVRDWIRVDIVSWTWPNFNIADSLLVTGSILLVWHTFRQEPAKEPGPADQ